MPVRQAPGLVPAVFHDDDEARRAVEHLRRAGVPAERIRIEKAPPGHYHAARDPYRGLAASLLRGIGFGIVAGTLAGFGLFEALAALGLSEAAFLGTRVGIFGALFGAGLGAMIGGLVGMTRQEDANEAADALLDTDVDPGEVLVVVQDRVHEAEARAILKRDGAHVFLDEVDGEPDDGRLVRIT